MEQPPPLIPVKATSKSKYKSISKLNGDDLPLLKRLKKSELTGRITFYKTFTEGLLNTKLGVWYRQHEHVLDTLKKEQKQVYRVMCRMQRERRRVQRDEHERLREEIRRMFRRQRKRQMIRKVIAKFKENVIKKKEEREAQEQAAAEAANPNHEVYPERMLKYVGGFRRMTEPKLPCGENTLESPASLHDSAPDQSKTAAKQDGQRFVSGSAKGNELDDTHFRQDQTTSLKQDIATDVQNSESYAPVPSKRPTQHKLASQSKPCIASDSFRLDAIPETEPNDIDNETTGKVSHQIQHGPSQSRRGVVLRKGKSKSSTDLLNSSTSSLPAQLDKLVIHDNDLEEDKSTGRDASSNLLTSRSDGSIPKSTENMPDRPSKEKAPSPRSTNNNVSRKDSTLAGNSKPVLPPIERELQNVSVKLKKSPQCNTDSSIAQVASANEHVRDEVRLSSAKVKRPPLIEVTSPQNKWEVDVSTTERLGNTPIPDIPGLNLHHYDDIGQSEEDWEDENDDNDDDELARYTESHAGSDQGLAHLELPDGMRTGHRRSVVQHLKAERRKKAKQRSKMLDNETIVRYKRRPYSNVTAMYGQPKKMEFLPPSLKLRHEQEKLIRTERGIELERQIKIERFFEEVFKPKDDPDRRFRKLSDDDNANKLKKPTLSLAGVLGSLFTTAGPAGTTSDPYERLKSCQYLRVYRPRPSTDRSSDHRVTSWDTAESTLRAGFMKFAYDRK